MNKGFDLPGLRNFDALKLILNLIIDTFGNELRLFIFIKIPIDSKHKLTNLFKKVLFKVSYGRGIPNNLPIGVLINPALIIFLQGDGIIDFEFVLTALEGCLFHLEL